MAEGVQINPRIKLATKVRLEAFRKKRGCSQGEVIDAALEAYFSPADGDSQTLLFQKVNSLEQGMKDVVTLLGTVIQHLERQSKPPPKIATRDELYPELRTPADRYVELQQSKPLIDVALLSEEPAPVKEVPTPATRSSWRGLFGRRSLP